MDYWVKQAVRRWRKLYNRAAAFKATRKYGRPLLASIIEAAEREALDAAWQIDDAARREGSDLGHRAGFVAVYRTAKL